MLLKLSPALIIPFALALGGDLKIACIAAAELGFGMIALDMALDIFMAQSKKIMAPQYLVILLAATTNLAELGASQGSAFAGDPISEVAATPLGSNTANLALMFVAFFAAWGARRRAQLRSQTQVILVQVAIASVFAISANLFQYWVRPSIQTGSFLTLFAWLGVHVPLVGFYLYKTTFSKKAAERNAKGMKRPKLQPGDRPLPWIVFALVAIVAISPILDSGVTHIALAIPGLGKTAAGFFIMSFISSLGEYMTTLKFFKTGDDYEATKNIADSNSINIVLAMLALLTGWLVSLN